MIGLRSYLDSLIIWTLLSMEAMLRLMKRPVALSNTTSLRQNTQNNLSLFFFGSMEAQVALLLLMEQCRSLDHSEWPAMAKRFTTILMHGIKLQTFCSWSPLSE
ncbi:hypothetical protein IFM89_025131 [Coptis chinensis]|uniref:Uncharacterized protein n=1 Tax=Coptis chinensis TaxID=261450 RepID=A0A835MJ61_9MAGN|nr:hypothetical protein IFM89_025131 [Coptis chinensis]